MGVDFEVNFDVDFDVNFDIDFDVSIDVDFDVDIDVNFVNLAIFLSNYLPKLVDFLISCMI